MFSVTWLTNCQGLSIVAYLNLKCPYRQNFYFLIWSYISCNDLRRKIFFDLDKNRSFFELLRGEKLNYNSCTNLFLRKSQNLLFLAPEVQWALKVYRACSIHVFFKCFGTRPYLVCHVTTIEKHLNIYNFRNIVHFLKRILQVVDNAVFWQNVLLYFENDSLSPSF